MKRVLIPFTALMLSSVAMGQTLNVHVGNVVYQFPVEQAGELIFNDASTITIKGRGFSVDDISYMTFDDSQVSDNLVRVEYGAASATVYVAGNVAQYVEPAVNGAHVSLVQTNTAAVDGDEITYQLSGSTTDGEFSLAGSYKCSIALAGLTLTNPSGAAINITNGKRIQLSAKKNTTNTLTDGSNGDQKACLYSKGQLQLQGNGTLNVLSNTKHGIKSGDYIEIKNLTLNITKAVGDGISCNEYFLMESGNVTISGVGDDGIQCDLDGDTSTGETTSHEDEDSGNIYIEGGTLKVGTTATATKGVKAAGSLYINENSGTTVVTVTSSGGVDATVATDLSASACLKSDAAISIAGGTLTLTNSGQGGRAINADGTLNISGGNIVAQAQGANYGSSSGGGGGWPPRPGGDSGSSSGSHKYAKGVKADGNITITGGTLNVYSANHEGMESKGTITISDGEVTVQGSDDAINSASDFTIKGGKVMGYSTGNDGLDANGNFYIQGGLVYAIGKSSPELGIDANTEERKKLYVSGGTIVAIGGMESGASLTQSCYSASSWSKNTWYTLTNGNEIFAFKTPASGGTSMVVSASSKPTLKSGVTVSGGTSIFGGQGSLNPSVSDGSTVNLSNYNR